MGDKVLEFAAPVGMSLMFIIVGLDELKAPNMQDHIIGALIWVAVAVTWSNPWVWKEEA